MNFWRNDQSGSNKGANNTVNWNSTLNCFRVYISETIYYACPHPNLMSFSLQLAHLHQLLLLKRTLRLRWNIKCLSEKYEWSVYNLLHIKCICNKQRSNRLSASTACCYDALRHSGLVQSKRYWAGIRTQPLRLLKQIKLHYIIGCQSLIKQSRQSSGKSLPQ